MVRVLTIHPLLRVALDFLFPAVPLNTPLVITIFNKPRIQESNGTDIFSSVSTLMMVLATANFFLVQATNEMQNKAIVPTTSHIPLYLSTILEVLSNVLSPVLISQWFLADIVRRTTESAKCVFDYCLSPSCSTIAAKRVRSLSRIMASTNLLIPLSSAFQTPLRNLLYRTLIYRVHEGPKMQYEVLDKALEGSFRDISGSSPPAQVIHAILEMVRIESWVEPGVHLCVGPFIMFGLPLLNNCSLQYLHFFYLAYRRWISIHFARQRKSLR